MEINQKFKHFSTQMQSELTLLSAELYQRFKAPLYSNDKAHAVIVVSWDLPFTVLIFDMPFWFVFPDTFSIMLADGLEICPLIVTLGTGLPVLSTIFTTIWP